ncbi:MAG: sulfotransferase family protein [Gemmatimonadales bacterium]
MTPGSLKRLFIVGCPRSGTTWTMMLLARHPAAATCMQVGVMSALHELYDYWALGERRPETRYVNSVIHFEAENGNGVRLGRPQFAPMFASREEFFAYCRTAADEAFAHVIGRQSGTELLIVKTPEDIRRAEFVHQVFPDAYFLHVVRDPRAVFASQKRGSEDFGGAWPRGAVQGARYWQWDVKRGRRIAGLTDRYAEVRYETLTADPAGELGRLLAWLGLPAGPEWCREAAEASSFKQVKDTQGAPKRFFRSGKADAWRDELSRGDLRVIEHLAGALMAELGYSRTQPVRSWPPVRLLVEDGLRAFGRRAMKLAQRITPEQ